MKIIIFRDRAVILLCFFKGVNYKSICFIRKSGFLNMKSGFFHWKGWKVFYATKWWIVCWRWWILYWKWWTFKTKQDFSIVNAPATSRSCQNAPFSMQSRTFSARNPSISTPNRNISIEKSCFLTICFAAMFSIAVTLIQISSF